jgi:CBS domain-containing membrane protein
VLGEFSGVDEWLMASLGASALLVFVLPQSPMAQPWAVITGNTLSALVGITTFHFIDQSLLAIPLAASLSILGIFNNLRSVVSKLVSLILLSIPVNP